MNSVKRKLGSRVLVQGEVVSPLRQAKSPDGLDMEYYLVRVPGATSPVAVLADAVQTADLPKRTVENNTDFDDARPVIAKRIREYRKAARISQSQFAEMLGVSQNAISQWETGVCVPRFYLIPNICNVLEIDVNDLYETEDVAS